MKTDSISEVGYGKNYDSILRNGLFRLSFTISYEKFRNHYETVLHNLRNVENEMRLNNLSTDVLFTEERMNKKSKLIGKMVQRTLPLFS